MLNFKLPFQAYSINNQYYADRKFGMRKEAKEYCYQVNWQINAHSNEFEKFSKQFNPALHSLKVQFTHVYKEFYNKAGHISSKCFDLTNTEKLLLDLLFDERHHGQAPYKSPNLSINDKYVTELISKKCYGPEDCVLITIELVSL